VGGFHEMYLHSPAPASVKCPEPEPCLPCDVPLPEPHESSLRVSVVTPTVKRESGCDYIHILASAMWMNTSPDRIGTTVAHWTIFNGDRTVIPNSALSIVQKFYQKPLSSWWSLVPAPDHADLHEKYFPWINPDTEDKEEQRSMWQIKECIDYVGCLEAAIQSVPDCTHVVIFEDDFLPMGQWAEELEREFARQGSGGVYSLWFQESGGRPGNTGSVAIAWERSLITDFIPYVYEHLHEWPIDWCISRFLKARNANKKTTSRALGQHSGLISSFKLKPIQDTIGTNFGPNGRIK